MTADLKPYPEMKDSGVNWLGDVPEHWRIRPGRAVLRTKLIRNEGLRESRVLSLSYGRIIVKPEEKLRGLVPESFETYQIVDPGDIIIRSTDLQNDRTSLRVGHVRDRGIITSAYMCLRPTGELANEYGYQFLNTYDLSKVLYGYGSGLRQNLSWADFKYMPIVIPSGDEQTAIVRFIDYIDRRIRRYIRAKRKLIKLLEEQKQAIIHQAVTGQIDVRTGKPYPAYKPSGIEWLGEVPEHWNLLPLGSVLQQRKEKNDPIKTTDILSLSLHRGVIPYSEKKTGGNKAKGDLSAYMLAYPGDIVVNSMNVVVGSVGLSNYFGAVSPVYYMLRPRKDSDLVEYFNAVFQDAELQRSLFGLGNGIMYIESKSTGKLNTVRLRIPMTRLRKVAFPCPAPIEQANIVKYLDQAAGAIDTAATRTTHEIELLSEYRTRLIADVVTGKLDVREAAASLPDEPEDPESNDGLDEMLEIEMDQVTDQDDHDQEHDDD